ncbi:MAG TPA: DNA-binding domain-containing protein [Candidatus Binataceae bacterium]|nr:DNA-binding domain-containing protein [Candidatus Binataceae bacterium]
MPPELKRIQELLYRLITAPGGAAEGLAAERGLPRGGLGAVIGGDDRLSAVERVDIYANMYFYRLLDVLRHDYPATAAALGEANFHNLITGYLIDYPPSEPSVFWAGCHLAEYLRGDPLGVRYPFAADLAALERATVEVFCARDTPALDAAAMRATPSARWPALRMRAVAALGVLDTDWRVGPALRRFQTTRKWKAPEAGHGRILVWRRGARVFSRELAPPEARAIAKLKRGASFAQICAAAAVSSASRGSAGEPAAALNAMLARWLADAIVARPASRRRAPDTRFGTGDAKLSAARRGRAARVS